MKEMTILICSAWKST